MSVSFYCKDTNNQPITVVSPPCKILHGRTGTSGIRRFGGTLLFKFLVPRLPDANLLAEPLYLLTLRLLLAVRPHFSFFLQHFAISRKKPFGG